MTFIYDKVDSVVLLSVSNSYPRKRTVVVTDNSLHLNFSWRASETNNSDYERRSKAYAAAQKLKSWSAKGRVLRDYFIRIPSTVVPGTYICNTSIDATMGKHLSEAEKAIVVLWEVNG